jgi:signal transduction histidine kinase
MFQGFTLDKVKEEFFSDPKRHISLKKGDVLMEQSKMNDRLYLLLEGKMTAYITDPYGMRYSVFRLSKHMFAGVYSFFSGSFVSKTTIVARADCKLAYIEAQPFEDREDTEQITRLFLPVILTDLNARMNTVRNMARDREVAVTQLLKAEKMTTLGQLAAGLAHELNNAVGVLKSKSLWLGDRIGDFLAEKGDKKLVKVFEKGRNEGNQTSSKEVREVRKEIADTFGIKLHLAKELARTGYSISELKEFKKRKFQDLDTYWDIGAAFYDMELAARHATSVVHSVKELGGGRSTEVKDALDLNTTITESLTLIQSILRQVELQTEFEDDIHVKGSSGELVQIWINLCKNAIESMVNAHIEGPLLIVTSKKIKKMAHISIIDNGPGIPENLIEKIFQPDVTTKKGGLSFGLGLGLPISERIIESYGGQIKVTSEPGRTEFIVTLPLKE